MTLNDLVVFAQGNDWDGHHDGGWWIVMGFGMIVFWVLVIALVVWLVRTWSPGHHAVGHPAGPQSPLDVLDHRLAEGSISVEEYQERRRILTGGGSKPADEPRS